MSSFFTVRRRRIHFAEYGAPDGYPVLALHGTPGSHLKYKMAGASAANLGLRLICPDRWGYGQSDLPFRPTLMNFARDMHELVDALNLQSLAVLGISGGGPFAAATAVFLGSRIDRLALVSPVGQLDKIRLADMRLFHALCFRVLPAVPGATDAIFTLYRRMLVHAPRLAMLIASIGMVDVDRKLLRCPDIGGKLSETFRSGLALNAKGAVCDLSLFKRPWEFDPSHIQAPTRIWIGTHDRNVPQNAAHRLADAVPNAELVTMHKQGHYWIAWAYAEVLAWLAGSWTTDRRDCPGDYRT